MAPPLAPLLSILLLVSGLPAGSSLKLELVRRDNRSALGSGLATSEADDDDKPSSDDDDAPSVAERRKSAGRSGSLTSNVVVLPAPMIGSTEMISPWGPAELALQAQYKTWTGSWNLKATYTRFMEDMEGSIQGYMDKYGMADTEVVALMGYTLTDYRTMNNVLRGVTDGYTPEEVAMANVASELAGKALERLPSVGADMLFRGTTLPETLLRKLQTENFFYDPGFLSVSSDLDVAFSFAAKEPGSVIFQIVCPPPTAVPGPQCKGKSVSEFSIFKEEEEIIFPPGSKFAKVGQGWFEFPMGTKFVFVLEPAF